MKRSELEHVIRASASIADDDEIVVIGSQSILGPHPNAPEELLVSNAADVFPRNHPDRADLIDGSIGELSPFHESFGYYAQGVSPETATLPSGWESRLVPVKNESTRGATGLCLEPHDLLISKYVAGREKDLTFNRAAVKHALVSKATLLERLETTELDAELRRRVLSRIEADFRP